MTENEAIDLDKLIADAKALAKEKDTLARTFRGFKDYGNPKSTITSGAEKAQKEADQYKQVAKLFEELQQYRAIGTVEEIQSMKDNGAFSGVELVQIAAMQMRLKGYETIGTIEKFKALKEKNEPKKVIRLSDNEYYDYKCPTCGMPDKDCMGKKYCNCGQALEH